MTIFTTTSYSVGALIADIDLGKVGLPGLQRPFVWANVKVRNLFDSLYKGYPAGFLLFWDTGQSDQCRNAVQVHSSRREGKPKPQELHLILSM